jgi:hypothetical protein
MALCARKISPACVKSQPASRCVRPHVRLLESVLGVIAVLTIVLVAYSYIEWRHDPEKSPPSGTLPG